jgi:hypothetical protein
MMCSTDTYHTKDNHAQQEPNTHHDDDCHSMTCKQIQRNSIYPIWRVPET